MEKGMVEKFAIIRKKVSRGGIVALSMSAMMLAGCASKDADDAQVTESQDVNVPETETQAVTETVNDEAADTSVYEVRDDLYFFKGDTQIGTFEVYENCDFAASLDEFVSVLNMSDASFTDERKIASEGKYTLTYAELSVQPSAAKEIEGEEADTEWHYYIHDGGSFFVDVTLDSKDECTDELEEYLKSYMKSLADGKASNVSQIETDGISIGDNITVSFAGKNITVQSEDAEAFTISLKEDIGSYLISGWESSSLHDMNGDGRDDIVFTCKDNGTDLDRQMVYIIDVYNQKEIPVDYSVDELIALMPKGDKLSDIMTDTEQDCRNVTEDGVIEVHSAFGTGESHIDNFTGEVTGRLLYDESSQSFKLDETSVSVNWY